MESKFRSMFNDCSMAVSVWMWSSLTSSSTPACQTPLLTCSRTRKEAPMIRNIPRSVLFIATILAGYAVAQVATGTPPFGSFGGGPFDTVNLGNLNVHFGIPVVNKAGRGMPFSYVLSYDSSVWFPLGVSGNQNWQPVANFGWRGQTEITTGYLTYKTLTVRCPGTPINSGLFKYTWFAFVYHDSFGTSHGFIGSAIDDVDCGGSLTDENATTTDGSGWRLLFSITNGVASLTSPTGQVINPVPQITTTGTAKATDSNGNQITVSGSGVFTDTLGTTAVTVSGTGTPASPLSFAYSKPTDSSSTVAVVAHYTNKTVQTSFNCSGISEYGPTTVALITDITLPNASKYTFQYELTPGTTNGNVTGRLKSITLPSGGTLTYTYTGGNNGIICADGSAAGLTRVLSPGGAWSYTRSGSGNSWSTTVNDPSSPANQTLISFAKDSSLTAPTNNFYETQRQVYQGSATGTLLRTTITCYNGNNVTTPLNCPTTSVSSQITRRTKFTYLPDSNGKMAKTDITYNVSGLVTEQDEYDFPSSTVPVRKTTITYASLGNNIVDRPASIVIKDGNNALKASTIYSYDQSSVTATSG